MCWTPVRQSTVVQKATPIHFRSRSCGRSSVARMGSASGAGFAERAFSGPFRESYHPYCNAYGDISGPSVQTLRANGAVQLPSSTSTPCFLGCGSRLLPRRFSQQLYGPSTSPTAFPRELEGVEERATREPLTYVMLPLDTVNAEGIFRYAGSSWFSQALQLLVSSGAHGVAMDFWWGAVERSPGQYNWSGYKQVVEVIKQTGLKVQAVLSFHACGGNVGDTVQIPLPEWVLQCGEADPDLFFADRPRNGGRGNRNREYISIWADEAPGVLRGRSPMQCYEDFMISLRENFSQELGTVIDELVIGAGPCGELRLPSYVEANGWRFPGAGEFQCYDRRALASLAQAAREAGHPEWGYTGPHDAGDYNSKPEHTGFFSQNGSWNTPYGRFFLEWYSNCLIRHGERLLAVANQAFVLKLARSSSQGPHVHLNGGGSGGGSGGGAPGSALTLGVLNPSSQSFQFLHNSSSGRLGSIALNRILEIGGGCGGDGGGVEPSSQDAVAIRPSSLMLPPSSSLQAPLSAQQHQQHQPRPAVDAAAVASISPSCTCSSISTCTTTSCSSGGAGSRPILHAMTLSSGGGPQGLTAQQHCAGGSGSGGGNGAGTSANDLGGSAAAAEPMCAVLGRRANAIATWGPATGTPQVAAAAGGGGHGGGTIRHASSRNSTISVGLPGGGGGGSGVDTAMLDIEPSDASHTPTTIGTDMLLAPPASSCNSGALCRAASALPSAGPSPLAAVRFCSSVSTLGDTDTMYGQGTMFAAAAAAAGVILASSSGPAHVELCNSLSSLSTEFHTGGGGGSAGSAGGPQTSSALFMDVAASLVADGDDESDIGMSCGTGVPAEEADELFGLATAAATTGTGRVGCLASREGLLGHAATGGGSGSGGVLEMAGVGTGAAGMAPTPAPTPLPSSSAAAMLAVLPPQLASPTASYLTGPSSGGSAGGGSGGGGGGGGLHLALKIAGIHWWYRSRSHAAELTAGYYNVDGRDGYAAIVDLCARHRANLVLTCVEMCDSQHPTAAQCGPEGLLRQLRHLAARAGVALSGENALPIFSTGGVDTDALDRIVQNMRSWPAANGSGRAGIISPAPFQAQPCLMTTGSAPTGNGNWAQPQPPQGPPSQPLQHYLHQHQHQTSSSFSQLSMTAMVAPAVATAAAATANIATTSGVMSYRMSESGKPIPVVSGVGPVSAVPLQDAQPLWQTYLAWESQQPLQQAQQQQQQYLSGSGPGACASPGSTTTTSTTNTVEVLPGLRAFTFLRLVPEMLLPGYRSVWMHFMGRMMSLA